MELSLKKLLALKHEEVVFVFSMMRKYGGMTAIEENAKPKKYKGKNNNRRNQKPKKEVDTSDKTKPNLSDFTDPKWEKCTDEKFLTYREIMERTFK